MPHSIYRGLACMFKANKTSNCTNVFKGCSSLVYLHCFDILFLGIWRMLIVAIVNICKKIGSGFSVLHWISSLPCVILSQWAEGKSNKFWNTCAPFVQNFGNLLKICHKNKAKLRTLDFVRKSSRAIVISPGNHMDLHTLCVILLLS